MAAKKKGSTARKKSTKNTTAQPTAGRRQLMSVIWFAVAVFFLSVVFIKGQNIWLWMHNFTFGIFGITVYFYPFLVGFIAIMYAMEKISGAVKAKIIVSGLLVSFIGAAIDIFSKHEPNITFWKHLANAYVSGTKLRSGGLLGALIGKPLYAGFGKAGAAITVILLVFVFLMIVTGTSLISLFKAFSKPVKTISEQAENAYQNKIENEGEEQGKQLRVIKGFDVDISVEDMPEKAKRGKNLNSRQRKVVSAYYDDPEIAESDEPEIPEGADDEKVLNEALQETANESAEKTEVKEQKIDFFMFRFYLARNFSFFFALFASIGAML